MRKVEASIQSEFKNGLPPHLQPDAKSKMYIHHSEQSRIFVTSHSEFKTLHAGEIQNILCDCLVLVHGNPLDYDYGWDLESFRWVHDVDQKTVVHGENLGCVLSSVLLKLGSVSTTLDPEKPEHCHHQGTLWDFYKITTSIPEDEHPPLNTISLPASWRNLYIPSQFGSVASHEVAQSCMPPGYDAKFKVPSLKGHMEWSLIRGKGAISPFHVDSVGLGTVVVVLEGSKYWIVIT